ncbi:hypothetical protein ONZ43_g183 [Nemania bipapillata]|uniref:Uncharacterized protein n=1 Tax=Nemania bipapillata TaxID=110536 RepID=A0ACC2J918_9PEZI|nr:hypothetical protein ONZ43_g183 [Nemania bipapillata]
MISSTTAGQNSASQQKHRACDECRIRKLACTKEPDGCCRCRRESIPCHYSAQKPMGRPRKRAREEPDENPLGAVPPAKTVMTEQPPDTEDPGMQFINLLLGSDLDFDLDPAGHAQTTATMTATSLETPASVHTPAWDYTSFGEVNFDSLPADHMPSFTPTNVDPALFITPSLNSPPIEQVPVLSPPNSNKSSPPQSNGVSPAATVPSTSSCDCTTNLYSTLAGMQKLPTEVEPAIRQARLATKVAYEVVNCPSCSFKIEYPTKHYIGSPTMMRGFQNMMLLATLIPSIVHAYAAMLSIVDEETNRAVAERRKVVFKLNGLGGIWGGLGSEDEQLCGAQQSFDYREMEPIMWRLTVRAY